VLLTGRSGTGKEVAARTVHSLSDRSDKPFVPVNCAAIPPDMMETEFFGHLEGAFTGAKGDRQGLFTYAQGGTLFLDEISELPLPMQSKLLRVLEDRRVRPVGSEREVPVDLRFIFATNTELEKEVEKGRFRADLFFRINVMQIHLPLLKDREDDVLELAALFMRKLSQQLGMPPVVISESVRTALARYDWPGNVRELRNLVERSLILGMFPDDFGGQTVEVAGAATDSLAEMERRHILAMLRETGGNKDEAARRLGISRKTIDRKCALWNA
jgi:transcriptional regulator with PAS, ATPase and Fis domain